MLILAELSPLDTVAGTRVTLRAASSDDKAITGLNNVRWWPAIVDSTTLTMRLFDGDFSSDVNVGGANLSVLVDKLAKLDANARRFLWAGAGVKIYAGNSGDAWQWTQWFDGLVEGFEAKASRVSLKCKVNTEPFEKNALIAAYAGTGGVEGDANLKNKVKPWLFGRAANVEPVLINAVDNVYQFSAYGPIQAVTTLYERASDFGAAAADYASYAALVAATVPDGKWATCLAEGLIRLGAPAAGVITGDVDGDKPGGVWIRKTGEIINRIATNAGISSGLIDTASLTALDTAVPFNINLFLDEQTTVLDIARRLARPCNAQAGVSWMGKLFVTRPVIGTPAITLDAQGRQKPGVISSVETDVSPPYWRIEMGAQRSWRVHSFDEIATAAPLIARGAYSASETYREGNIVLDQDSSWRYINTTAGSGNAPPTLPTTSNSFWEVMAKVGPVGATGAAGANAKVVVVEADRNAFTFDGANNLSPGTQSSVVTATPTNFTGGNVVWSYSDNLGTASATLAGLVTATSANVRTVPSTVFTGTLTRTWLKVTATGQGAESGLSDSTTIVRLNDGSAVLTVVLSNEAHTVPTDSAGGSGVFTGAVGQMTVYYGTTDVTATATLSEVSETGCTGDINTALNTPFTGAKGAYRVTAMSADTATYKMRAVYNPGSGNITVDRDFTLAKSKTGATGAAGQNAIVGLLTNEAHTVATAADGSGASFTGAGGTFKVFNGTTEVTTGGSVTFSVQASSGVTISINSSGVYSITAMSADQGTATLRAVFSGVTIDKDYVIAKSKAGATGATGSTGPGGPVVALAADAEAFPFTDGVADNSSQTITFTATRQNTSETVNFTTSPSVTLGGSGLTRTLTIANFGTNRQVVVTATGATSGASDTITVMRLEKSTAAANAGTNLHLTAGGTTGGEIARITIVGNTYAKGGAGGDNTNAWAISSENYVNGAAVTFRASANDAHVIVGFSETGSPTSISDLKFGLLYYFGTFIYIIINGATGNGGSPIDSGTFTAADQFTITYDGVKGRLWKNGVEYSSFATTIAAGKKYHAMLSGFSKGAQDVQFYPGTTNDFGAIGGGTKPEDNADVTSTITGPAEIVIECDYTGAPITGELTKTTAYKLIRNGTTITSGITWTRTLISGTVTTAISGSGTAQFDVSAITTDSVVRLQADYLSTTRVLDVSIKKNIAQAPTGGTGGSGNPGTTASDSTITSVVSSSYGSANAGPLTVKAGTNGQVDLTAPLAYRRTTSSLGTTSAFGKWQWRVVGGSFADVTTEISSSASANTVGGSGDPTTQEWGSLTVTMQKTGLTSSTDYEFQLLLRGSNSSTIIFSGTATAAGS